MAMEYNEFENNSASEKIRLMLEDPVDYPQQEYLLTESELTQLDDQTLLEQFTLARFCKDEKARYSREYSDNISDMEDKIAQAKENNGDSFVTSMQEDILKQMQDVGDPGWDKDVYRDYYDTVLAECESRGYSVDQLERDSDNYITQARVASLESLTGTGMNIHMLAAINDTSEQSLYYYMTMSPSEREFTPRFKSDLEGDVLGVDGGSRFDEQLSDSGTAVMNEGMTSQVVISHNEDGTYHCESDYLGTFDYNPDDWAIGYKEVPGSEADNPDGSLTKVPVFRYVGDLVHDQGHAAGFEEGFNVDVFDLFDTGGLSGTNRNEQVHIPDGVKVLDYTFEGNGELQLVPGFPTSVISAHCCFKDCSRLHGESHEFKKGERGFDNSGGSWDVSDEFVDGSSMFKNCSELGDICIGTLPHDLQTIDGMFAGCPQVLEEDMSGLDAVSRNLSEVFGSVVSKEADWSDSPYLMSEFSNPVNADTSNAMKRNYEREEKERQVFQAEFSSPENLQQLSEEELEDYEDAKGAEAAVRTETVMNGEMTVRSIDEVSYDEPESNSMMAFLQHAAIDLGSFAVLKGVTGKLTGSKLAGWVAGIGGTALLDVTDILPESIEPALQWVKQFLPEGGQKALDKFIDVIHVPQAEEYAAADADRMGRYKDIALTDSMGRSVWSADVFYDDEVINHSLKVNGRAVAEYGVLQRVGEDGRESSAVVKETLEESLTKAEGVFNEKMEAMKNGNGDGYDWNEEMRRYYWQMLYGLEGYSDGAVSGINDIYSCSEALKDKDNAVNKAHAMDGLAYVNCDYAQTVLDSLHEMDDKYHFMTMDDWIKLDSLEIHGVESLSDYVPGQEMQPVGLENPTAESVDTDMKPVEETTYEPEEDSYVPVEDETVSATPQGSKKGKMAEEKFGHIDGVGDEVSDDYAIDVVQ